MADVERQIVELSTLATVPPPPVQTDEEIMALIHEKRFEYARPPKMKITAVLAACEDEVGLLPGTGTMEERVAALKLLVQTDN